MLKKTIAYKDYDNNERVEDFYFNLSKAEILEMEYGTTGGMTKIIEQMVATQDTARIMKMFKEIIMRSYGEKSLDGKRFIKSPELSEAFIQTEAYSNLFMELIHDPEKFAQFIKAIIPDIPEAYTATPPAPSAVK